LQRGSVEGPVTVAVTGPFASGKSTLVRFLGGLPDTETASADEIVHHLLKYDRRTISRIIERFGEGVRGPDGIDRKALGREVFGDAEALRDLEEILHPLVRSETDRRIEASSMGVFVVEIPLLFETGRGGDFDFTVAVTVPEEKRRAWAAERGLDEAALRAVEARQLSGEEKARLADLVVQNDGDLNRLGEQAHELGRMILRERGSNGNPK
jgi:dephospho-CoA kinase